MISVWRIFGIESTSWFSFIFTTVLLDTARRKSVLVTQEVNGCNKHEKINSVILITVWNHKWHQTGMRTRKWLTFQPLHFQVQMSVHWILLPYYLKFKLRVYASVNSKLQQPTPHGHLNLWRLVCLNSRPRAKSAFKCPTLAQFLLNYYLCDKRTFLNIGNFLGAASWFFALRRYSTVWNFLSHLLTKADSLRVPLVHLYHTTQARSKFSTPTDNSPMPVCWGCWSFELVGASVLHQILSFCH